MGATKSLTAEEVLKELRSSGDPNAVAGMARFGIVAKDVCGVSVRALRRLARRIGRNHRLAQELWATGNHEARTLAALVDKPARVTPKQMERWVKQFNNWAVCDACCCNLFDKTAFAYSKAMEWSTRSEEFVKRAGFTLMAALAVHDKAADDGRFLDFLPVIARESTDGRNFVRKAANWALRQIGKRNLRLNRAAVETAREIRKMDARSAKWIAADALRELTDPKTVNRIRRGVISARLSVPSESTVDSQQSKAKRHGC